jgi:midasin
MDVDKKDEGGDLRSIVGKTLGDLPDEILEIIQIQKTPRFLDVLATKALNPKFTLTLFMNFENVFTATCAKWIEDTGGDPQSNAVIEGFARILPFAPHLSTFLEKYLETTCLTSGKPNIHALWAMEGVMEELGTLELQKILLAAWRLLNFDKHAFERTISAAKIQNYFQHGDRGVRYLAVRIFCLLISTSDLKLEAMIEEHVGKTEVTGDFDGELIDYGFLTLVEGRRSNKARTELKQGCDFRLLDLTRLSGFVARYSKVLLPRPKGQPSRPSTLVTTSTTARNMESVAKALLSSSPILLHGLAGSGKTSLVNDFAREFGVDSNMVTLHLNEQTDAKMLIGMYTSGSTPGSFTWRPGVLTTAVREGRWVFIEDLDRAPNEVISVILPLIERGELLIPSRGEIIKARRGFKLLATIRTSLSVTGHETPPAMHMLGSRLWLRVPVQMPSQDEFREIIDGSHPILHQFLPGIINVYERLYILSHRPSFVSRSRTSLGRPISPRDLLKWCRRMDGILVAAGSSTGREPITEATKYEMFLEATDCFASSLQSEDARKTVVYAIAEEMHIDPQRVEHFLTSHIPRYEDNDTGVTIGRVRLQKRPSPRVTKSVKKSRPFANTTHVKRLLEQVGVAVKMAEPILLVGETGIGKTTVVQQLADTLGFKLTAVNLSQQSEVGDLLGGFKPVNVRSLAIPLKDEFDDLFASTGISATKNQRYLELLGKSVAKSQWNRASKLWREAPKMFDNILSELMKKEATNGRSVAEQPTKRRKTESRLQSLLNLKPRWERFSENLDQFDVQLSGGSKGFAFTFVEGNIVKAARNGDWVLLDEINLASPDTLESIADLLHSGSGGSPSILLSETGEIERVVAHPNFRIFGAMNPATDVGKRDLPMGLRSRFTEIYVESPDRNLDDLLGVIRAYLRGNSSNDERAAHDVARLYLNTKRLADEKRLVDGANQVPHFSLRTLTRVLSYVIEIAPSYGLRRALYEGFAMGFLTLLNRESEKMLMPLINHHLLDSHGNPQALLSQTPKHPEDGKQYVRFMNKKKDRQYWMMQGGEMTQAQPHYIITPFVERNMLNLVRATSTRRFPVLVQGPTSSGKTSMIEYLAKFSGNKFVRINNHEHTDLQEYLGTYVSGSDGQLRFQEGLLVQALRQGHWIVLDELNLAPTDVLEALNRLLDDNRELLIPETQEIVRPHENFMLFATQNPPGLYGGRKTLSRAFRNRFLELHFDDIPEEELHTILQERSQKVAPSDCKRIVDVYKELSRLRQTNRLFEQKDSFATLRDLFRWALRDADNREQLAANGYMLLAERVRNPEERTAVREIIERVMKVKIDPHVLYNADISPEITAYNTTGNAQGVVWTQAMRRLYVLVAHALRNNEPVLLVGETGCGKTTVCQMLADAFKKELHIVNAHQNTETGDLIGAQRPIRNRATILEQLRQDLIVALSLLNKQPGQADLDSLLETYRSLTPQTMSQIAREQRDRIESNVGKSKALFEWSDGSLIQAMKEGQFFLLDEISLADDSVLERLNSVLETQRTILLAEKGVENSFVQASDGFQFFATMNPGGDYGKRELSPALRNRFTEIWVPSLSEHEDVFQIVNAKLDDKFKCFAKAMVHFAEWFGQTYRSSASTSISVRDVLAWVKFMNSCSPPDPYFAVLHGAAMVYIDTLGANPAALLAINPQRIREERARCLLELSSLLEHNIETIYFKQVDIINEQNLLTMGDFSLHKQVGTSADSGFAFDAPTTKLNAMRVIRALQVHKPILIEGSPGVGKTTLIAALAHVCNRPLTRINLSEQTDLMDLFGSDVPVEGAEAGHFAWRDAPFLQAMQKGEWVLLDEMNLASQSVLEGLNACLDHRGEVYISELDQTFKRHPNFSVFAAQNPHHQGGGRKGLPSSFVNRFTVVYADVFRDEDLELICRHNFPSMPLNLVNTIISFVSQLEQEIVHQRRFGSQGGPWEFNLRDILRWLQLLTSSAPLLAAANPSDFLNLIFRQRFRASKDRLELDKIFAAVFGSKVPFRHFFHNISNSAYQVGLAYLPRDLLAQPLPFPTVDLVNRLPEIESVMMCIQENLPCILVGQSGSGKTTIIQHIAATAGKSLIVFPLNADIDTMDLVGGFEQVDPQRAASSFLQELNSFLDGKVLTSLPTGIPDDAITLVGLLKDTDPSPSYFDRLASLLQSLKSKTSLPEFGTLADTCQRFSEMPMTLENARFEWVDGILVKALEQGHWLVLDNANLCSASVLDRLNSLLEPNGVLSINEHSGPDGEPKLVRPHPDFRIFFTMDPRFGELSRAMRNRAIEIFIEPLVTEIRHGSVGVAARPEASMQRYQNIVKVLDATSADLEESQLLRQVALENLSWSDMPILSRFSKSIAQAENADFLQLCSTYSQLYESSSYQNYREAIGNMFGTLAEKTNLVPVGFRDAQVSDRAVPRLIEPCTDSFNKNQIIHPLQNSPLVPLLLQSDHSDRVFWLGAIFDLMIEISAARRADSSQREKIETLKPSKMNRLQRSLVRGRVPAVAKDSTVNIAGFLGNTLQALELYLQSNINAHADWKIQKRNLTSLLRYWWDTFTLATGLQFEEATFQAHLAIGTDLLSRLSQEASISDHQIQLLSNVQHSLNSDFSSGFKLTTGLSMEVLWRYLRPSVISSRQVLNTLLQMEQLASRFDALRWKTSNSIADLGNIMTSLVSAYHLILTSDVNGAALVQTLDTEMDNLEKSIGSETEEVMPYLAMQFEALRQYKSLENMTSTYGVGQNADVETAVLANQPSVLGMHFSSSTPTSRLLQTVDSFWGAGDKHQPITDSFSSSMLARLNQVGEVDLKSLKLLETELPILGRKIAISSAMVCKNQAEVLNDVLLELIPKVLALHGDEIGSLSQHWCKQISNTDSSSVRDFAADMSEFGTPCNENVGTSQDIPSYLNDVLEVNFRSAISAIAAAKLQPHNSLRNAAIAWSAFALGCIKLYVPDRAFDPDKRQRLERQRNSQLRLDMQNNLQAFQQFERIFSAQDSNLRCQLLAAEISEFGDPPEVLQEIYRPESSEMDQLQGEFSNLLKTVLGSDIMSMLSGCFDTDNANFKDSLQQIHLMQSNVMQIIRRLSERFRAYNDLTRPVISMLRCLQIGLFMATQVVHRKDTHDTEDQLTASKMTPFMGGSPGMADADLFATRPMDYLQIAATTAAVESLTSIDSDLRHSLLKTVHECYDQWTKRLESDRVEAESKSGLYRFRGSAEDEDEDDEEQFNELFPSYEDDAKKPAAASTSSPVRETAIELAKIHSNIFLGSNSPTESIRNLIRHVAKKIGNLHDWKPTVEEQNLTGTFLPGTLLVLNDEIEALSPNATVPESYNFYTDANLPESRKLVSLVHQIQARFRELQAVDEIGHMQPLADVLASCNELLQFRHIEPLAKIITKVEKVHGFMHEWQFGGWASRANSALTLYDNITATIVSWRRLELSTWAKLFDMETNTCDDDARSWWFVAYQVVVAAPLQISLSNDELKSYAQKLLKDLEAYFSTAIIGQFVQRLQLLKQLQKHLELVVMDFPAMSIILGALTNFISLYSRYEKPVHESLKKGRVALEKAMRDVLLLASWKDTNIVALRDSAKRSHHKLFKIVRKFRALLGQPMESILKQGLPDEASSEAEQSVYEAPFHFPTVDPSALTLCAASVPNWSQKSKRFINVSKTVSMMADASQISSSAIEGSIYLDSFLVNIITSTAELQKATPSILTEDNKDTVKHLKSRKRKLFADTLKELRQMGIKYNLGVDALAKQDSLSLVLASTDVLHEACVQGVEYYFHKAIDIAPRAREAARQHSEDLSSAEVARSTGFLEGLLQLLISQHNCLSVAVEGMEKLQAIVRMAEVLWAPDAYEIRNAMGSSNHGKVLKWLPNILAVAMDLIRIHAKMSKIDSQVVLDGIAKYHDQFSGFLRQFDALAKLPVDLLSTERYALQNAAKTATEQLSLELEQTMDRRPDLAFVLKQISTWASVTTIPTTAISSQQSIAELDQKLSMVCDSVLVAIEKHKKAVAELPSSAEDLGWLIKNDFCLTNAINSLHADNIIKQIGQAFDILRYLNLEEHATSRMASAIFAVALPILQQYFNILQQSVTRYGHLHRATCKTSYILTKTFTQIANQGFCTPSEKSDAQDGKTEKLEGGTGLGDGEGAEDISKDVQDDEDLDELAQEPNTGESGDIEDEQDAVDMTDGELEGEMGEGEEKNEDEDSSGEESGDDMDQEAGDVDDLDPTAVDEKMWDGDGEKADKDQDGDDSKGKQSKDEQVAAQESNKEAAEGDGGDEEEMEGAEQGEELKQDEVEKHDPHAQEGEALDLPEDMELDGNEDDGSASGSDDGMDDLSDVEQEEKEKDGEETANDGKEESDAENMDAQEDQEIDSDMDVVNLDDDTAGEREQTEDAGEKAEDESLQPDPENQEGLLQDRNDDANADEDNAVPSDVQGAGEDQDENSKDDKTESASKAQREDGGKGGDSSEQKDAAAEDGEKGRQANGDAPQDAGDETQDASAVQPFKKLGDALESWHRQQTKIRDPAEQKEPGQDQNPDLNAEASEFQHLQDEDAEADTQAMGTATEEQAHALDESMAVDSESKDMPDQFQPDDVETDNIDHDDGMDSEDPSMQMEQEQSDAYEGRAGAMIKQAKDERNEEIDDSHAHAGEDLEEEVEEVDNQLESTHLGTPIALELRSASEARQQWTHYESLTRDLSLSLTEQLRLILAPTLATKMRGEFRTGKRLNIKRIIPYIASQYKRDKIWMRRSVPSKRSYQIMLAVDDSKSMGESGSGSLAFETLVMVSKSLSMLEVGEICVVGFGENVNVAHNFDTPFSSDAGPKVFQNFGFEQKRTDVTKLVRESIELFRAARAKASSSPSDLWQMELIISDGVCDSSEHEPIRRLLREALEERIMMVFVIVDDVRNKKKGESVMDLKEAKFVKNKDTGRSDVRIERYLDTFPFQYYLIVSDVKELPGVLATLLRQWFAEVVDSST